MTESADGESPPGTADAPADESSIESEHTDDDHLTDVEEGAGCAEIWEHLSERRAADDD
jgi:hypothetical protein